MCFFDWLKIKMKYLTHLDFQRQNPLIFEKTKTKMNNEKKHTNQRIRRHLIIIHLLRSFQTFQTIREQPLKIQW